MKHLLIAKCKAAITYAANMLLTFTIIAVFIILPLIENIINL